MLSVMYLTGCHQNKGSGWSKRNLQANSLMILSSPFLTLAFPDQWYIKRLHFDISCYAHNTIEVTINPLSPIQMKTKII